MMIYLSMFAVGIVVGSFLNVVGLRWNSGLTLGGRSFCPSCRQELKWWELIPVASFIFLRGHCRRCHASISWQYPVIEIWTGAFFASFFYVISPTTIASLINYIVLTIVFCIYTVILVYDFRHKIIPDKLVYPAIFLSLLYALASYVVAPLTYSFADLVAGPVIFIFFASIWFFSSGRAMGFGDAKLGLSVGLLLGGALGFSAIVLAFWIGTASALIYMLIQRLALRAGASNPLLTGDKRLTMKSEVPFGPFIILASFLSIILELNLLHVTSY
jgi:prepilin signal peptidase PulO-like enzyme (type II secretory pathway)